MIEIYLCIHLRYCRFTFLGSGDDFAVKQAKATGAVVGECGGMVVRTGVKPDPRRSPGPSEVDDRTQHRPTEPLTTKLWKQTEIDNLERMAGILVFELKKTDRRAAPIHQPGLLLGSVEVGQPFGVTPGQAVDPVIVPADFAVEKPIERRAGELRCIGGQAGDGIAPGYMLLRTGHLEVVDQLLSRAVAGDRRFRAQVVYSLCRLMRGRGTFGFRPAKMPITLYGLQPPCVLEPRIWARLPHSDRSAPGNETGGAGILCLWSGRLQ